MTKTARTGVSRTDREIKTMFGYFDSMPLILSAVVGISAALYLVFLYLMAHQ
jgi:hypothetical protein